MLDTGSVGLRLWGGRPASAAMTSTRVTTMLDGARVPGLLGTSPMSIGGVTTTLDVPFQLISTDSAYIQQWKSRGVVGILGMGSGRAPSRTRWWRCRGRSDSDGACTSTAARSAVARAGAP